jgi:hypothetical protein
VPSIVIAPRHPSPLSRHRSVLRRPSSLQSQYISVALVPSLAVHCCRGAVVLSITVKSPSRRPSPFIAVHHRCDRSPSPSPLRSRCPSLYRRRGAAVPTIAVKELMRRQLMSLRTVHHHRVAAHCRQSVHCFHVSVAPSIAVHHRQVAIVPSIAIHHPPLLSLSCAAHCCPRHQAVAVHRPSPASVQCRCAVNRRLSSGWLLCFLSSRRRLLSTSSGFSARHVQPFSDARHNSVTCWEAV